MALHPPKRERFDVSAGVNIDPKGIARSVEEYRVEPFGLYMARPTPGRAQFHYLESWLLPDLGLRITDFWFSPATNVTRISTSTSSPSTCTTTCGSPPTSTSI